MVELELWHIVATAATGALIPIVAGIGAYVKANNRLTKVELYDSRIKAHGVELDKLRERHDRAITKLQDIDRTFQHHVGTADQRDHEMQRRLDKLDNKVFNGHAYRKEVS